MATTQTAPKKKGPINFDFLQKLGKVLMTVIACGGSDDQSGQASADGRR